MIQVLPLNLKEKELKNKIKDESLDKAKQVQNIEKNMPSHRYTASTILVWILLVSKASSSLRSASRVMEIFSDHFSGLFPGINTPTWYTGRLWLMRLGYYKLNLQPQRSKT